MTNSKNIRVAVSGVGGGVGQSIIKSLEDSDYQIVALDSEPLGTGLFAAPMSYVVPRANDPAYISRVLDICERHSCKLLFPGMDAELPVLSRASTQFSKVGTTIVVSKPEVIELSDNKYTTFSLLRKNGISVPETVDLGSVSIGDITLKYPFIVKRREGGARSKDVYLVSNSGDLKSLEARGIDFSLFIAQEYIEGDEYTCGSINFDGDCLGVIVMRRVLRDGDTYKCFVVRNDLIEGEVKKLMRQIKPFGACNVQMRVKDGKPIIFEINARCSGTTAARSLCGFNEPKMIADYLCLNVKPNFNIKEQSVLRYWKELVVSNEDVLKLEQKGSLSRSSYPKL